MLALDHNIKKRSKPLHDPQTMVPQCLQGRVEKKNLHNSNTSFERMYQGLIPMSQERYDAW